MGRVSFARKIFPVLFSALQDAHQPAEVGHPDLVLAARQGRGHDGAAQLHHDRADEQRSHEAGARPDYVHVVVEEGDHAVHRSVAKEAGDGQAVEDVQGDTDAENIVED